MSFPPVGHCLFSLSLQQPKFPVLMGSNGEHGHPPFFQNEKWKHSVFFFTIKCDIGCRVVLHAKEVHISIYDTDPPIMNEC